MRAIDLNSDLGEGYGPWRMGDDAAMLDIVTSANVACGGHAGDPETMFETLVSPASETSSSAPIRVIRIAKVSDAGDCLAVRRKSNASLPRKSEPWRRSVHWPGCALPM